MIAVETAPAKLNLTLHVRRRRPDGYHDLETLFAFVADGDSLRVSAADDLVLTVEGPMAAGLSATDNLVLAAARALADTAGIVPRAGLVLTKNLPVASGVGGGSADAAAALRLLNRFWGLDYPLEHLAGLAESLGADVPACVYSSAMIGTGRGERLAPVSLPIELAGKPVLLANPAVAVATGPVFATWDGVDRGALDGRISLASLRQGRNDLEPGAMRLCPVIAQVLAALSASPGVLLSRMSGSGATCFAIFASEAEMKAAKQAIAAVHPGWWLLPTRF